MVRLGMRSSKLLVMVCINSANLVCHSVYSVLAAFFPQEAKAKGMSEDGVGIIFASFAGVIFIVSPVAGKLMTRHGKVWVYIYGLLIVSVSTVLFGGASLVPEGWPFYAWCLIMRIAQGVGSALEETAAYAIIADLDWEQVSLYLGICEISTGLGYMVGPPLGGFLFSMGGFAMPFLLLGSCLLPAAALIYVRLPPDAHLLSKQETQAEVPMRALLADPQIIVIAISAMLANSDYAFLEPTLGDHARDRDIASSPDAVGMLFSVASVTYTLSCPLIGIMANRDRVGPRPIIVCGLLLQLLGFVLIGPSPILRVGTTLSSGQMLVSLTLFGLGESMSMTPVMDDMMHSCGENAEASVNALSSMMASSFSLGQMIGPLIGSGTTSRFGFPWACTLMAGVLALHILAILVADVWSPRKPPKVERDGGYLELSPVNVPAADSVDDDRP